MAARKGAAGDRFGNHCSHDGHTISPSRLQTTDHSLVQALRVIWWGQIRAADRAIT